MEFESVMTIIVATGGRPRQPPVRAIAKLELIDPASTTSSHSFAQTLII